MRHAFVVTLLLLITSSCSQKQQAENLIDKEKFEAMYVELLDSAAVAQPASSDSTLSPTAKRILERHEVSIEQFKATVNYYNSDTKEWKEFYEDVVKRIDERSIKKPPP